MSPAQQPVHLHVRLPGCAADIAELQQRQREMDKQRGLLWQKIDGNHAAAMTELKEIRDLVACVKVEVERQRGEVNTELAVGRTRLTAVIAGISLAVSGLVSLAVGLLVRKY